MDKIIEKLKKLAVQKAWIDEDEDFSPYDYCGGNYDDAYWGGSSDGEIILAREILDMLEVDYGKV